MQGGGRFVRGGIGSCWGRDSRWDHEFILLRTSTTSRLEESVQSENHSFFSSSNIQVGFQPNKSYEMSLSPVATNHTCQPQTINLPIV